MKSKLIFLTAALALLAGCSGQAGSAAPAAPTASMPDDAFEVTMTLEELAQYDGKDGKPAYVAVDGAIYDMTDVPQWDGGEHFEGMTAGQDLTRQIKEISPHGISVLENLPVVGRLAS